MKINFCAAVTKVVKEFDSRSDKRYRNQLRRNTAKCTSVLYRQVPSDQMYVYRLTISQLLFRTQLQQLNGGKDATSR